MVVAFLGGGVTPVGAGSRFRFSPRVSVDLTPDDALSLGWLPVDLLPVLGWLPDDLLEEGWLPLVLPLFVGWLPEWCTLPEGLPGWLTLEQSLIQWRSEPQPRQRFSSRHCFRRSDGALER